MNNRNKTLVFCVVVLFIFALTLTLMPTCESYAFHIVGEDVKSKISLKTDFVDPENGDSVTKQRVWVNFQKGDLGFGGNTLLVPEKDYLRFRPYITVNVGPITPIVSLSTDSNGVDHISAGIWHFRKISDDLSLFVDLRNFWGLNSDSVDFTDNFATMSLNLGDRAFTGLDLIYDHYWESNDDWYLVGVSLGYKVSDNLTAFVRPAFDRFLPEGGESSDTYSFRVGVNVSF